MDIRRILMKQNIKNEVEEAMLLMDDTTQLDREDRWDRKIEEAADCHYFGPCKHCVKKDGE